MKLSAAQLSRVGARAYNEDRVGVWRTGESMLLVVADGMGGHQNGEVAAQVSVDFLGAEFARDARPRIADPDLFLFRSVGRAHAAIIEHAARAGFAESPRTVIVACVIQGGYAWWTHIGDSRLYFIRNGRIIARTRDHTRVQQLVDSGRVREEAVANHPERNVLLQCLGGDRTPKLMPAQTARLEKDDLVLLCSDGFWGPLTQRQLMLALTSKPLGVALTELADLAELRAGPQCDNVSVAAIRWDEEAVAAAAAPYTVPLHDLATEVQDFTATDLDFMRMTDDDIDRAISEIRSALKKNPGPGGRDST